MKASLQSNETPPMSQDDLQKYADDNVSENGKILGKFNSVEDLAASYKELEGKLGDVAKTKEEPVAEEVNEYQEDGSVNYDLARQQYGEKLGELFEQSEIDPFAINKHYQENNGTITEEHYKQLEQTGLPRNLIDSYLNGLQPQEGTQPAADPSFPEYEDIVGIAGGEEKYLEMLQWMDGNIPKEELQEFDKIVDAEKRNIPQVTLAVQKMFTRYRNAMGVEPKLISGQTSSSPNTKVFRSNAEVVAAMRDPRYKTDIAFQHEVQRRLAESNVFGISN
tara:strand:- start:296 stop:1129 length:834 start_codon:yes stop_codon:yes gene_type:complete